MKAIREKPEFIPVILTLETQHEVDALYALLNHGALNSAVELPDAYKLLQEHTLPSSTSHLHSKLCDALRKEYGARGNTAKREPKSKTPWVNDRLK